MSILNKLIVASIPLVPRSVVRRVADRYIAGEHLAEAITLVGDLNAQGMTATLDVLGESIQNLSEADRAVDEYLQALEQLASHGLDSGVSLKPSQFGLHLDEAAGAEKILKVVKKAHELGIFVRLDMEDHPLTTPTLDLYRTLRDSYGMEVGVVVQAYMRRTFDDVMTLIDEGQTNIRLCKGIYIEPRRIAYKSFDMVRENFVFVLEHALKRGAFVGIATHDEWLVWQADRIIRENNIPPSQYEFQMLLGVDDEMHTLLADRGHSLRLYVPYGVEWYAYSSRRLRENPQVARYVAENFFRTIFSAIGDMGKAPQAIPAPESITPRVPNPDIERENQRT